MAIQHVPSTLGPTTIPENEKVRNATTSMTINSDTVMHRTLHPSDRPQRVIRADGLYLHLENGSKFLDATSGAAVACLGHNHPVIKQAVIKQLDAAAYVGSVFFSSHPVEELCTLLIAGTNNKMSRAFICNSGSEAVEAAMKLARQYWVEIEGAESKRVRFVSRKGSYHGATLGCLGLGGHVLRRRVYEPLLAGGGVVGGLVTNVRACYEYRERREGEGETVEEFVDRLVRELEEEFLRVGPETVCAFIAEPVVGAALGCVPPVEGYWPAVRDLCDKYGILLIADEIMSGMGRSGYLHAWQSPVVGVVPDLQTLGKGLSGGYQPCAALLANHRVVDAVSRGSQAFAHGQTFQAMPVCAAAAAAVQKEIMKEGVMEGVRRLGGLLEGGLKRGLEGRWFVGDVRGMGLFWGIEFVRDRRTKEPFEVGEAIAMGVHRMGMEEPFMISLYPGTGSVEGTRGDFVMLAPPYNCSEREIDLIVEKTVATIDAFFKRKYPKQNGSGEKEIVGGESLDM